MFYLRYHGYSRYFPVWALATYGGVSQARLKAIYYDLAYKEELAPGKLRVTGLPNYWKTELRH